MGKSDSGNKFYSKSQAESREVVVGDGIGGGSGDGGGNLKKGPWTASEDAILVEYVKKHGEGNWNAVQKNSGLLRCGKSCRLRWANHLRPNLRKGPFTPDEERLILELHAKIGNKWARMAAHLPGRTDNEIKNFWNTRVKRLQRVGLPLYPPDVSSETMQENQQSHESGEMVTGGKRPFEALQTKNCDLPDGVFHGYVPRFSDISSYIKMKRFDAPPDLSFMLPAMHSQKHLRQLTAFPGYSDPGNYRFPSSGHLQENSYEKVANRYNFSSYSAPHPACKISLPCSAMQNSQSLSTGNSSASKSTSVAIEEEEELPSFQYPNIDKRGLVETSPPQPLLDPVDTYIMTPPENDTFEPESFSPRNSGLLDALVYEGKALCAGKNNCSDKSSHSSAVTRDICNSSNLNVRESAMEDRSDPLSPFGQSATSLLKEHTLVCTSGSSLDEQLPAKSSAGCILKSGPGNAGTDCQGKGITSELTISRPDVILASSLLNQTSEYVKDQSLMNDPLSALYDDFGSDLHSQGWDFSLSSWSNLPPVCQISEQP